MSIKNVISSIIKNFNHSKKADLIKELDDSKAFLKEKEAEVERNREKLFKMMEKEEKKEN